MKRALRYVSAINSKTIGLLLPSIVRFPWFESSYVVEQGEGRLQEDKLQLA